MRDLEPAQTTPSFPCAARSRTAPRFLLSALPVRQVLPSAPTTEGSPLRQKYEAVLLPHIFCFLARFLSCAKAGSSEIVTLTRLDILCQAVPFRRSLFRRFAPYKSRLRHQQRKARPYGKNTRLFYCLIFFAFWLASSLVRRRDRSILINWQ